MATKFIIEEFNNLTRSLITLFRQLTSAGSKIRKFVFTKGINRNFLENLLIYLISIW